MLFFHYVITSEVDARLRKGISVLHYSDLRYLRGPSKDALASRPMAGGWVGKQGDSFDLVYKEREGFEGIRLS